MAGLKTRGFSQYDSFGSSPEAVGAARSAITPQLYRSCTSLQDAKSKLNMSYSDKMPPSTSTSAALPPTEPNRNTCKSSQSKDVSQEKTTPKPMNYSQQLRVLKGRKMELLQMSHDQLNTSPSFASLEKDFVVGGRNVNNINEPKQAMTLPTPFSSISNLTKYSNVLAYTKYRSSTSIPTASVSKYTKRSPAIVIPCHTNTVCTYCQLYDEDHGNHEQEQTTSLERHSDDLHTDSSFKKQTSMEKLAKINLSLKEELNSKESKLIDTVTQRKSNSKKTQVKSEIEARKNDENITLHMPDICTSTVHNDSKRETMINPLAMHCKRENVPSEVLPKVYKLRYTKSSVASMRSCPTAVQQYLSDTSLAEAAATN